MASGITVSKRARNAYCTNSLLIVTAHIRSLFLNGEWQDISARAGCFET